MPFEDLIEQLAPGEPSRFEASWLSAALVRLRKAGLVETSGAKVKLWQPSTLARPRLTLVAGGSEPESASPDEREAA